MPTKKGASPARSTQNTSSTKNASASINDTASAKKEKPTSKTHPKSQSKPPKPPKPPKPHKPPKDPLAQEPPIIITGGSVHIKYKRNSFKHNGDDDDNPNATLQYLIIDNGTPIQLTPKSVIKVYYG